MFQHSISFRARLFVCVFAVLPLDTIPVTHLRAQGAVAARLDKAALSKDVEALLHDHGGGVVANLWVGGDSGNPWFELSSDQPSATASAIKTFYLVELFAAHRRTLDNPLPGADAVLKDDGHTAISHFSSEQRAEIRRVLGRASVRRVAEIMMGKANASNAVYNAAANLITAVLGGPEMLTKLIRDRDPAFKEVAVRRYMLRDRKNPGDNEAPAAALAALYQRLAARALAGIDGDTMRAIRETIVKEDFDNRGVRFSKDGSLASDPLTEVRAGWWETARGPVIYVIMMRESTFGPTPLSARRLRETVDTLMGKVVGAGLASIR
jgi:Beta-lactamase enzyme family